MARTYARVRCAAHRGSRPPTAGSLGCMSSASAFAAFDATSPLRPFRLERREPGPRDVEIDIVYCGVCHSDLHTVRSEWSTPTYPCVPGDEIVGRVTRVGAEVKAFAPGAIAAVGCMVDSCRSCDSCLAGLEQYCDRGENLTALWP